MPTIHLKTEIPGPCSRALTERRQTAVPRGPYNSTPIFVERAKGATITDVDGNTFIDFAGGIGAMNLGHANAKVTQAITSQAQKFTHTCYHVVAYEPYVALAEKLNLITPGHFAKKTMFANSGAEAVENAIKIARYATGRTAVICFEHAFHGRTFLALSLTSKVKPYKYGFGPLVPEIYRLPYPHEYRWHHEQLPIQWRQEYQRLFDELFSTHVAPDKIAALIIEPVTGEGGFMPAAAEALETIAEICSKHGIVLIDDEVQTGFCRTGKFFAIEWAGIVPDIILTAKSLASGMPISAITGRAELMDSVHEGGLGGTYGGNALACTAALATIDEMESMRLHERALAIGETTRKCFNRSAEKQPLIGDVRGLGAMNALEFVLNRETKQPHQEAAKLIQKQCCARGLIVLSAGTYSNVVRTLMPLCITDDELHEGLEVLEKVILELGN